MQTTTITKTRVKTRTIVLIVFAALGFAAGIILISMNFSSQAPEKNWNEPWQNACEETSVVIVDNFYNKSSLNSESAKKEILSIFSIKEKEFGPSHDENVEEITYLINNFLNWEALVVENPTIDQIKEQLKNNNPVILPADGKKLSNKYFNTSGYHVFVISGYDDDKKMFITQEPGTQFGKNYLYSYATVESAMRDYNPNGLNKGKRVAIFTSPNINTSANTDGDGDGLKKIDELKYKTSLISADTDGNGYSDSLEAEGNHLPTVPDKNIQDGELIKMKWDTGVYLVQNNKKRHLVNADVFNKMGKSWDKVATIDANTFNSFPVGNPINSWPEVK